MELWQIIWYLIIIVVCLTGAFLIIMLRIRVREDIRAEKLQEAQSAATKPAIYSILRDEYGNIVKANSDAELKRQNLDLLSTIIEKLEADEDVDTEVIIFLLSRMNKTTEVIEKIKRVSTVR